LVNKIAIFIVFISSILSFAPALPQSSKQSEVIAKPLDDIRIITGTFGELRKNHFHTGVDFSTKGETGKPVYSVFDGYVSRIKVSPFGYGKVIYITHPNGLTSVYAHLGEFNVLLNDYIVRKQYELESYEFDLKPDPRLFPVKKNDIIGYSGNSGISSGPHLHFEIRSTISEKALNPYIYGIPNNDNFPPVIEKLRIYTMGNNSLVDNSFTDKDFDIIGNNKTYRLKAIDTIYVSGKIVVGVRCYDLLSNNINKTGIYSLNAYIDGETFFSYTMDSIDFEDLKYVNSLIDYEEFVEDNSRIQKCQVSIGNRLSIYGKAKNFGIIDINDERQHKVKIVISDYNKNYSELNFIIKGRLKGPVVNKTKTSGNKLLYYGVENKFDSTGISLIFPPKAFYDSLYFGLSYKKASAGFFSDIFSIQDENTPVHGYYTAIFDVSKKLEEKYYKNLLVAGLDKNNKIAGTFGGTYSNGKVTTKLPRFGRFALVIDTAKPTITPLNIYSGKNIKGQQEIKFKLTDNISGVKKYRCEANNKWLLFEYDAKNSILTYKRDRHLPNGVIILKLEAEDERGNKNVYNLQLIN
jgi:murein DD-endopeptidase MepM/ murein hydrolase activator NlpD